MFSIIKKKRNNFLKLFLILPLFTFFSLSSWAQGSSLRPGFPAPSFSLNTIEEVPFNLTDLKGQHKLILLYFYQQDQANSLRGIEELTKYFEGHITEEKYQIIMIHSLPDLKEEDITRMKEFWSKQKLTPLVLLDNQNEVSNLYKVENIPSTFLLDGNLILKRIYAGFQTKQQEIMFQYLSYFLNAQERGVSPQKDKDDGCEGGVCPPPES